MTNLDVERKDVRVVIVCENVWLSILADVITFGLMMGLIAWGVYLDSFIAEIIGAILGGIFLFSRLMIDTKITKKTPEEAIEYLKYRFKIK